MPFSFLSRFRIKPERDAEFVALIDEMEAIAANETETLAYKFYRLDQDGGYAVFESFTDEEADKAHQANPAKCAGDRQDDRHHRRRLHARISPRRDPGVTEPIFTLGAMLRRSAADHEDDNALVFPDRRLSYGDAQRFCTGLGEGLRRRRTFSRATMSEFLLATRPEFVELLFGITMAGAVAVPINARYQPGELAYLVSDADLVATGDHRQGRRQSRFLPRGCRRRCRRWRARAIR